MRLTHIFIGIAVMVVFSISLMTVATNIGEEYNTTYSSDFDDITTNLTGSRDSLYEIIGEDIANKAPGGEDEGEVDADDYEGGIIRSSYKAIKEVPKIFNVFKGLITTISEKLMIDPLFYKLAFVCLVIVISLMLLSSILRNRF